MAVSRYVVPVLNVAVTVLVVVSVPLQELPLHDILPVPTKLPRVEPPVGVAVQLTAVLDE